MASIQGSESSKETRKGEERLDGLGVGLLGKRSSGGVKVFPDQPDKRLLVRSQREFHTTPR